MLAVRLAGGCLGLGAGGGFGDGAGVSVFPAAVLDDALDAPAVGVRSRRSTPIAYLITCSLIRGRNALNSAHERASWSLRWPLVDGIAEGQGLAMAIRSDLPLAAPYGHSGCGSRSSHQGAVTLVGGVGQGVDLGHREDRTLSGLLLPSTLNPARVTSDQPVVHGGVEDRLETRPRSPQAHQRGAAVPGSDVRRVYQVPGA